MPSRTQKYTLDVDLSHIPATVSDAEKLIWYDINHREGNAIRYRFVSGGIQSRQMKYRARICEVSPWMGREVLDLPGRQKTATAAAREAVRYLRWRYGDRWDDLQGERPESVDSFNDELRKGYRPVWLGRIWAAGRPVLVFADQERETGFKSAEVARQVAARLVEMQMPTTWRNYLGRYPRPFAEPMPAGLLVVPATIRAKELLRRPEVEVAAIPREADHSAPVAH